MATPFYICGHPSRAGNRYNTAKKWLSSNFEMKDMGDDNYVFGVKIVRDRAKRLLGLSYE